MQVPSETTREAALNDLLGDALLDRRGIRAWRSLLQAHASIVRELATDLVNKTGLTLGDFDVLAQLAFGGGELRMSDLAARVFSSRSGMTRRVDRLVDEGLLGRSSADADARGVVVTLTDAGLARLQEVMPIHTAKVSELFVEPLEDDELEVLESALGKVSLNCSFG